MSSDEDVEFPITDEKSYAAKAQARQPTHASEINSVKDTVAKKIELSQEHKNAVRQVFHAKIGDLVEYDEAKGKWPVRWADIAHARREILTVFDKLQNELGPQLDFTWDQLLAEVMNIRSASLAGSSGVTERTADNESECQEWGKGLEANRHLSRTGQG